MHAQGGDSGTLVTGGCAHFFGSEKLNFGIFLGLPIFGGIFLGQSNFTGIFLGHVNFSGIF